MYNILCSHLSLLLSFYHIGHILPTEYVVLCLRFLHYASNIIIYVFILKEDCLLCLRAETIFFYYSLYTKNKWEV